MLRIVLCSLLVTTSVLACWSKRDLEEAKSNMAKQTETAKALEDSHARVTGTIKFTCTVCKDTNTKEYDLPYSNLTKEHTLLVSCTGCQSKVSAPLGKYKITSPTSSPKN